MASADIDDGAARALGRMSISGAVLVRDEARGDFAFLPAGDRRRRPILRLDASVVRTLVSEGALAEIETGVRYCITAAGRARASRAAAASDEAYRGQHHQIIARTTIDDDGGEHSVRGIDPAGPMRRLTKLVDAKGRSFLTAAEIDAARRLRGDWEQGQRSLVRGSDWRAPPRGAAARGAGAESVHVGAVDARRRFDSAMAALVPVLAAALRVACLQERGLEELE